MFKVIVFIVLYNISLLNVECLQYGDSCSQIKKTGTCVPLPACKTVVNEILKAGNPMPNHVSKKLHGLGCGFDPDGPMICCKNSINVIPDVHVNKENKTIVSRRKGGINSHPNFQLLPEECGVSNGDRIAGGEITALYELPWMVLLSYEHIDLGPYYGCGGTLINERYVLTAAHCINVEKTKLRLNGVILGEHDVRKDPDCYGSNNCAPPVMNVTIEETIVHQDYRSGKLRHDIALVRLSEPANFSLNSMKPVCLPTTSELQLEESQRTVGTAAGWGITEEDMQSPILLSVDLPIIPTSQCSEMYKGLIKLGDGQICAGGIKDKDSCSGDSGGPLLYISQLGKIQRYTQKGIVSYGPVDCALGGYPTLYTKVSYYIEWILDQMHS